MTAYDVMMDPTSKEKITLNFLIYSLTANLSAPFGNTSGKPITPNTVAKEDTSTSGFKIFGLACDPK
jgi:hypothetical protein